MFLYYTARRSLSSLICLAWKIAGMPRFEPGAAGFEAPTFPLCHSALVGHFGWLWFRIVRLPPSRPFFVWNFLLPIRQDAVSASTSGEEKKKEEEEKDSEKRRQEISLIDFREEKSFLQFQVGPFWFFFSFFLVILSTVQAAVAAEGPLALGMPFLNRLKPPPLLVKQKITWPNL